MSNPWDAPEGIANRIEKLAETIIGSVEHRALLSIASEIRELAEDMRAGAMNDEDRLSWADHLAHLHGEER